MSISQHEAQLELCAEHHTHTGTLGWPVPYEPGDGPHASTRVCDRAECQDAASRWVQEATGHDGVYRSFEDARAGRSGGLVPVPFRIACMTCTSTVERDKAKAEGWLVDEFPTAGGVPVKVAICFSCRFKTDVEAPAERKPCGGTCKGDYAHLDGWRAVCTWLGHCAESWSCWDENCVREWAAEHDEPGECGTCHQDTWHDVTVKRISEFQAAQAGAR